MNFPKVAIIILNWNGWKDTTECLESLYRIAYPNYDIIVVDNNSRDESIEKIKEYCEGGMNVDSKFFEYNQSNKPIKIVEYTRGEIEARGREEKGIENLPSNIKLVIIKSEKNYGFPEGNNIGMRYALGMHVCMGADYLLLLNNDVVVAPDFLTELVKVAESDPSFGIVGSKIYYYYQPNVIQAAGGKITWWAGLIKTYGDEEDVGQYDKIAERDYIFGTSFLIKKDVIEKVSFMDPFFFFGVEEYDYCNRAKKAGFKVVYVPKSKIWHKSGASKAKVPQYSETADLIAKKGGFLMYKYYYRLFRKHCPMPLFILAFLGYYVLFTYDALKGALHYAVRGEWRKAKEVTARILRNLSILEPRAHA